jgi:hypothetical protein
MFSEAEYFEGFYVVVYPSRSLFMKCQSDHTVYSALTSTRNDTSGTVFQFCRHTVLFNIHFSFSILGFVHLPVSVQKFL